MPTTGVLAVALVVAATNTTEGGNATIWSSGRPPPVIPSLTFSPGQTVFSTVLTPTGPDGSVSIYTVATADYVVDVIGWFTDSSADDGTTGLFVPERDPKPLADTRQGIPSPRVVAGGTLDVDVEARGEIPEAASAALVQLTALDPESAGYATLYPNGIPTPIAATLSYGLGPVSGTLALTRLPENQTLTVYSFVECDFQLELLGWFTT